MLQLLCVSKDLLCTTESLLFADLDIPLIAAAVFSFLMAKSIF